MSKQLNAASIGALATALALSACNGASSGTDAQRPIVGLQSGEGVTFTQVPDGGALAILYDTARVEVLGADKPLKDGSKAQTRRFTLIGGKPGQTYRFEFRGARHVPEGGAASLVVDAGGAKVDLTPALADGNFTACADAAATGTTLDVVWTGSVGQVVGEQSLLDIDSIDITVVKPGAPPVTGGKCP